MAIVTWTGGRHLSETQRSKPVTSRKITNGIYCQGQYLNNKVKKLDK